MSDTETRARGLAMTAAAALIISPDSLLIRLVESDSWTFLFWRAFLAGLTLAVVMLLRDGIAFFPWLTRRVRDNLWLAILLALGNILFVTSIRNTAVANTLAIVAATPFFAALFSRLLLGETILPRTMVAILAAMAGVVLIVGGGLQTAGLLGNFLALAAALVMGLYLTQFRVYKRSDPMAAMIIGFIILCPVAALMAPPGLIQSIAPPNLYYLLIMGILIIPAANLLRLFALRHISSAEVGMVFLLETALAPLWVWLALNEVPPPTTLAGGGIIIVTLLLYSYTTRRPPAQRPLAVKP